MKREREIKFVGVKLDEAPANRCRAVVELARKTGEKYLGTAEGPGSLPEELRCVAAATLSALRQAVGRTTNTLALQDVTAIRVFGNLAIVAAVTVQHESGPRSVVGFCISDEEPRRAAALAVLNATNRVLDIG